MNRDLSPVKIEQMPKAKRPYHHGHLRDELIEQAWSLVREQGVAALQLRALARKAGVTHGAPYHHFADKDALLDAMALESFGLLDSAVGKAAQRASNARERLGLVGRAYIDFGVAEPDRLHVMFGLRRSAGSEVTDGEVPRRAFGHLLNAITALQAEGGAPAGEPMPLALQAWSSVHGFAQLVSGGMLALSDFAATRDHLVESNLDALAAVAAADRARGAPSPLRPDVGFAFCEENCEKSGEKGLPAASATPGVT